MSARVLKCLSLVVLLVVLLSSAGFLWHIEGALERGRDLLDRNRPEEARSEIRRYLWLHRNDGPALLTLAEAWARDDELPADDAAHRALTLLNRITPDSPVAGQARLQSARLRLLILHQPCQAEQDLAEALRHQPESFDANYLMWKLLDLTRRFNRVEPYFRRAFAAAPAVRRESLLREWYFSQFSTFVAASEFDQMLGFAAPGEPSDALTEHRRLSEFLRSEPDCALNHAVLADWADEYNLELEKWDRFERAWETADETTPASVYAILFDLLLDEGRFDEATDVMEAWPEPKEGYDYWKREGIYHAEVTQDSAAAVAACRAALAEWPGPVDWQLHHRLAGLLVRAGQAAEAERVRVEAKRLEQLMEIDFHLKLRETLVGEPSRESDLKMARFYADIGRPLESQAWAKIAEGRSAGSVVPTPGLRLPGRPARGVLQEF